MDRPLQQMAFDALPAVLLGDVDADLGGGVIGWFLAEVLEAEPASDLPAHLRHPDGPSPRVVLAEPGAAALDGDRLGVGGHHTARHRGVVYLHRQPEGPPRPRRVSPRPPFCQKPGRVLAPGEVWLTVLEG